ncbi:ABC transporter permease [Mycoplasmopsis anatis]|uniref:Oligopeptide ABC transporter, permease protein OppB n=1 Tax=Mycoplasmopsis anatis 1340 TaxID=1034808 RepID=F9QEL6_9BACT|nr:ABC transporter permease [Mycoplasmopsis anatis]EGS28806.1 oligopeptide ABC transporter, permease protein OppB [Mycoplasmopsis anatis 1340]
MTKYILQRLGFALLTLVIIVFVVYLTVDIFSDNPFVKQFEAAITTSGDRNNSGGATDKGNIYDIAKPLFEKSVIHHLIPYKIEDWNDPWVKDHWIDQKMNPLLRFGYWIADLFDKERPFGLPYNDSIFANTKSNTIPEFYFKYIKFSLIISLPSFVISALIGVTLGIFAGYKRGSLFDSFINAFTLIFVALPSFIIAPIVISFMLKYFGVAPRFLNPESENDLSIYTTGQFVLSWTPPILVIVLGSLSGYISFTRNQIITVLTSNYVLIAKTKGIGNVEIFFKYVLRNISIPLAAVFIPSYIGLLSGSFIVETYWNVPGISKALIQAFPTGEINLIMFSTVLFTALGLFTSIIVDVSYTILDPKIKYGSNSGFDFITKLKIKHQRNKMYKIKEDL